MAEVDLTGWTDSPVYDTQESSWSSGYVGSHTDYTKLGAGPITSGELAFWASQTMTHEKVITAGGFGENNWRVDYDIFPDYNRAPPLSAELYEVSATGPSFVTGAALDFDGTVLQAGFEADLLAAFYAANPAWDPDLNGGARWVTVEWEVNWEEEPGTYWGTFTDRVLHVEYELSSESVTWDEPGGTPTAALEGMAAQVVALCYPGNEPGVDDEPEWFADDLSYPQPDAALTRTIEIGDAPNPLWPAVGVSALALEWGDTSGYGDATGKPSRLLGVTSEATLTPQAWTYEFTDEEWLALSRPVLSDVFPFNLGVRGVGLALGFFPSEAEPHPWSALGPGGGALYHGVVVYLTGNWQPPRYRLVGHGSLRPRQRIWPDTRTRAWPHSSAVPHRVDGHL